MTGMPVFFGEYGMHLIPTGQLSIQTIGPP